MRVLFASKQHFGVGGIEASTDQLAIRLIRSGHEVAVVAGWSDEPGRPSPAPGTIRRWPGLGYPAWAVSGVRPGWALRWVRHRFRPDVIVVNGGGSWWHDWTRPLLDASAGLPAALYVRDVEALEVLAQRGRRPDLVVANAEAHAEGARRLGYRTVTVPSVIEPDDYRTTTTGECVLYINPIPLKGLHTALDLAGSRPDIPFVFLESWKLAKGPWRALEEAADRLGNVELAASTHDPRQYYARARVLLAPYRDLNRPRVVAEAQVSGIPVLARGDAALREAVGPGGVLVPPDAPPSAWVEALSEIWDDTKTHARLSAAALRHSQRSEMQPERVSARLVEALEGLVLRPEPSPIPGSAVRAVPAAPADAPVSVILPVRDVSSTIDRQLAALAAQTYCGPCEVIVADNGSRDDTVKRALAWADRLPDLRVVDARGRACVAHARNVGMRAARGSLLLVCDGDDEVVPVWVESMVAALGEHHIVVGALDRSGLNRPDQYQWIGESFTTQAEVGYGYLPFAAGGNLGLRREVLGVLGGFDERLRRAEDIDFSWRGWYAGFRVHFEPRAVVQVRMRDGLSGLAKTRFRGGLAEVQLYQRHRDKGMCRDAGTDVRDTWRQLLRRAPRLRPDPSARYEWVATAAKRSGRLVGSIRRLTLFP